MARPKTQLYMLMSLDGKISTGDTDILDVDQDFPNIAGVSEGLQQYYDIEKTTDINSFNTGRVMAKIGMNDPERGVTKIGVDFIIVDNSHLTVTGVRNLMKRSKALYLVTANEQHPAYTISPQENLTIIGYKKSIDFTDLFDKLGNKYGMRRLTVQSGGTINAELMRAGLIDKISVLVAPAIIGGATTSTLVDGESQHNLTDLKQIKALELVKVVKLKNSYLHLVYKVV